WISVEKFEHSITFVIPEPDIEDSFVPDGFHKLLSVRLDRRTWKAYSKCSHACIHGGLMKLPTGKPEKTFGILIKVSIEHPHRSIVAGNVRLNHQGGIRLVFHCVVSLDQFVFAPDDDHLPACAPGNTDVVARLEHDGKLSLLAKFEDILPRFGEHSFSRRNCEAFREEIHLFLVVEGPDDLRWITWKHKTFLKP